MARKHPEPRALIPSDGANMITAERIEEMLLRELRQALDLTQRQVAASLRIEQAAVSKMEKQTDMYLSTLQRFIAAMGGQLDIVARFPKGTVRIKQFGTGKNVSRVRNSRDSK